MATHPLWPPCPKMWPPSPPELTVLVSSERWPGEPDSLLLDQLDQPHVDVLPAAGLVAVDGDHVRPSLERPAAGRREREFVVVGDVSRHLRGEHAVDVDLGVLVVVDAEPRLARRHVLQLDRPAEPDVGGLPLGADDRARRALRPKAALGLVPLRGVEVRL